MKSIRLAVVISWLVIGLALAAWAVWSAIDSWLYFKFISGAFKAAMPLLAFALIAVGGAALAWRGLKSGTRILQACSVFGLLYALVYLLFGGLEEARSYLPWIIVLICLAAATLAK